MSFKRVFFGDGSYVHINEKHLANYEKALKIIKDYYAEGPPRKMSFGMFKKAYYSNSHKSAAIYNRSSILFNLATFTSEDTPKPHIRIISNTNKYNDRRYVLLNI